MTTKLPEESFGTAVRRVIACLAFRFALVFGLLVLCDLPIPTELSPLGIQGRPEWIVATLWEMGVVLGMLLCWFLGVLPLPAHYFRPASAIAFLLFSASLVELFTWLIELEPSTAVALAACELLLAMSRQLSFRFRITLLLAGVIGAVLSYWLGDKSKLNIGALVSLAGVAFLASIWRAAMVLATAHRLRLAGWGSSLAQLAFRFLLEGWPGRLSCIPPREEFLLSQSCPPDIPEEELLERLVRTDSRV